MLFAAALALSAVTLGPGRQPQVDLRDDNVAVVYGLENRILFRSSRDGGRTFSEAVTVAEPQTKLHLGMRRGPRVAMAGRTVVVTAIAGGELLSWRSLDHGRTWEGPVRVNTVADSAREGLHSLAAHPDGTVFAVWLDLRGEHNAVYGSVSRDGGHFWEERLVVQGPVCECCHPTAFISGRGVLHVMWRHSSDGARDMYYASSAAGWNPVKIGEGTWKLEACPMDGGDLAVDAHGVVQTIWRRDKNVYLATPGGIERDLGPGRDPALALAPGGMYAAWVRDGRIVLLRPDADKLELLAEKGSAPALTGPLAVWEQDGTIRIQRLVGQPTFSPAEQELEKASADYAAANAEAASAEIEYERIKALVERGDLPKTRLQQAETAKSAAKERAGLERRRLWDLQRSAAPE